MFERWNCSITHKERYEETDVCKHILKKYCNSEKKICIIDAGCSTGVAIKYVKDYLKQKNLDSFIVGIDRSPNIANKARENLDQFINKDIDNVDEYDKTADVVICSRMAKFVSWNERQKMIKKCISFLKDDGILITDVDYHNRKIFKRILNMGQHKTKSFSKNESTKLLN